MNDDIDDPNGWREYRQRLFNHLSNEHKLIPLEGELREIELIVLDYWRAPLVAKGVKIGMLIGAVAMWIGFMILATVIFL